MNWNKEWKVRIFYICLSGYPYSCNRKTLERENGNYESKQQIDPIVIMTHIITRSPSIVGWTKYEPMIINVRNDWLHDLLA